MFSSMFIGATGLKTHQQGLNVVSNNMANSSTVAYKTQEFTFGTLMSQTMTTGQDSSVGISQKGMGVGLERVKNDFSQGVFETSNTATDLAIGGKGFFRVSKDDETFYTRAGNFRFDNQGYIVDPHGYRLQGTDLSADATGATGDIRLTPDENGQITSTPQATTLLTNFVNLQGTNADHSTDADNPFFALLKAYDANATDSPLDSTQYELSQSFQIYDENGDTHDVTIYYDQVTANTTDGKSYWEYIVAMDPADEGRSSFQNTSGAGLLMAGTLTFTSVGQLEAQSAYTFGGTEGSDTENLSSWVPASINSDGFPEFTATVTSNSSVTMGLNLGLTATSNAWSGASTAADVGTDPSQLPQFAATRDARASTAHAGTSATVYYNQNGYGQGYLSNLTVDTDGKLIGQFSNGQSLELYQINLYNFTNEHGLFSEGNNHYSATTASGTMNEGIPGDANFGRLTQYALEQSNVDLAEQMVQMITTQRGFQANGKVITTTDSMLQSALNTKR